MARTNDIMINNKQNEYCATYDVLNNVSERFNASFLQGVGSVGCGTVGDEYLDQIGPLVERELDLCNSSHTLSCI